MTSKRHANPIRLLKVRRLTLRDRGCSSNVLYMLGGSGCFVAQINPISTAKIGEKSCDWLVQIHSSANSESKILEQVYVELKSKNHLEDAVKQLASTIQRLDPKFRHKKRSYAVGFFRKPQQQRTRIFDKVFRDKYKSSFTVISGGKTVPLYGNS